MWLKCGTKIRNEINEVKKSVVFFGSGIYPKKSVFVSFALRSVNLHPCPCAGQLSAAKAVTSA
jgi:hypothetical protein